MQVMMSLRLREVVNGWSGGNGTCDGKVGRGDHYVKSPIMLTRPPRRAPVNITPAPRYVRGAYAPKGAGLTAPHPTRPLLLRGLQRKHPLPGKPAYPTLYGFKLPRQLTLSGRARRAGGNTGRKLGQRFTVMCLQSRKPLAACAAGAWRLKRGWQANYQYGAGRGCRGSNRGGGGGGGGRFSVGVCHCVLPT
jgi:hypothetical protein